MPTPTPRSRAGRALALVPLLALVLVAGDPSGPVDAACCYFAAKDKDILQPGQKAFIQWRPDEGIESFTVQPRFEGNALDFGMVVPTPSRPKLDEMPRDFFTDLAIYTILLPLPEPIDTLEELKKVRKRGGARLGAGAGDPESAGHGVAVLEAGVVGSLDYKIITAERAEGLYEWLKENSYHYSGDEATLDHYIAKKWIFTVMKIDPKQMRRGEGGSYTGEVTPTRFTFESRECIYPLRITRISVQDSTDALFYVQAPAQMDLPGDASWMHSYRPMFLTFILGCSADDAARRELEERTRWLEAKHRQDPNFVTTKLEWARKLSDAEMSVLDDPLANYAQGGGGDLPPGSTWVSREEFLAWTQAEAAKAQAEKNEWAERFFREMPNRYPAGQGRVAKLAGQNAFWSSSHLWLPNREAPADEVKGLSRLKGHLQKGQWLTKFRRQIRVDEMTDDVRLVPVDAGREQEYLRIMPTSPP